MILCAPRTRSSAWWWSSAAPPRRAAPSCTWSSSAAALETPRSQGRPACRAPRHRNPSRRPMDDSTREILTRGREHYTAREYEKAEALRVRLARERLAYADGYEMLGVIYHQQ